MDKFVSVNWKYTSNTYLANQWLNKLPDLIACDFETASKYSVKKKELLKFRVNYEKDSETIRTMKQQINSNGLSYPALTCITHLSIAWSNHDAFVIVCDTDNIRKLILHFLTTTDKTQIWHNACFDFEHIYYHTGKIPKHYIDTQLLAKSILNDANSARDNTGLKELMAYAYGDWAISKDNFTLEEMYKKDTLRYSATDSCAAYKLYEDIMEDYSND